MSQFRSSLLSLLFESLLQFSKQLPMLICSLDMLHPLLQYFIDNAKMRESPVSVVVGITGHCRSCVCETPVSKDVMVNIPKL